MELFFYTVFGGLAAVVAALELSKSNKDRINTSSAFNSFKNNYLLVYSLMMGTDLSPSLQISLDLFPLFSHSARSASSVSHFSIPIPPMLALFFFYRHNFLLFFPRGVLIITEIKIESRKLLLVCCYLTFLFVCENECSEKSKAFHADPERLVSLIVVTCRFWNQ